MQYLEIFRRLPAWGRDLHRAHSIVAVIGQLVRGCRRSHTEGRFVVAGVGRDKVVT